MLRSRTRTPALGDRLLGTFGHLFVINLPERADRRREMDEQLALVGLGLDHPGVTLFPAVRPGDRGEWPSIGARGCFMSHLGVLGAARGRGLERILILEDDMDWTSGFLANGESVLAALEARGWDFVHGGLDRGTSQTAPVPAPLAPETPIGQTHFIALAGPAIGQAEAFLSAVAARPGGDPDGGPMHVDGAYCWFRKAHPEIAAFAFEPALAVQRASRTDIHDPSWFDRTPLVAPLVGLLRRLRNRRAR